MPAVLPRRGCLVALVVLVLGAVAAGWLVWRALDPARLRTVAETRLTEALGQPVTIGTMNLSFFPPGVEGRDIRISDAAGPARSPGVSLGSLRLKPRLSSVFSSPMVIERVEVVGLALDVRRDADGRWHLPIPALAGGRQPGGGGTSVAFDVNEILLTDGRITVTNEQRTPGAVVARAMVADITATIRTSGAEVAVESLTASLGRSSLAGNGSIGTGGMTFSLTWTSLSPRDLPEVFALIGAPAPAALAFEGDKPLILDVTVDHAGVLSATGRVSASRASLGTFGITALNAPFRLLHQQFVLDPVTFNAYGGTHRGRLTADTAATRLTWALDSTVDRVDVNQLVSANSSAKGAIDGTARVQARLRGGAAVPVLPAIAGTVVTRVSNGAIHNFPVLAAVNAALKVGAGDVKDLRFDTLSATWHVADGRATTADFLAESGELRLTAAGTLGFDQALDFRGVVALSKVESNEMIRRVRELAGLRNQQGEIEVPVTVTGRVGTPAFDVDAAALLEKAAREELKRRIKKGIEGFIK